jgi:two-component system sensor histidine kinase PhcS
MDSQPQPVEQAYNQYEREVAIANIKIGCILGMVLVPSFAIIDYTVYPNLAGEFLLLRLACSALIGVFFSVLLTSFGTRNYRVFGVVLVLLPGSCISYMIYRTQGADSPYYAGLNLVLLVVGFVLRWTFRESLIAVSLVVAEYLAACRLHAPFTFHGIVVNNLYFLFSTGVIVATGNHYFSLSRYREFVSRFELDKSRKALEASLHQLKENEMQLVQSEKLASLGRMSAGIIHEINNPLNFATTGIFTLRKKGKHLAPEQQADYAEVLTDVEDGLKRVQNIVSDLRQFTHPNTEQIDPVPVAEVVTPALRFLSNESRDTVQIEQKLEAKQMIWANKNKLIQVLLNLLQNSIDALKEKKFPGGEKPTIWIEGRVENGQSILSVRDNGSGIDPKHLGKIFDPFFTTKDVGSGMGLGLSICYSIVQEYGGKISVKTEAGKFCEFTLEFPLKNHQAVN